MRMDWAWSCLAALLAGCSGEKPVHERAWIGGKYESVEAPKGVLVTRMFENTPAAAAGLREGDVILRVDGKEVSTTAELYRRLEEDAPGAPLTVSWSRFGETGEAVILRGKERYERWGTAGLGLFLSPHLDLWPDPDFNVFGVLRLETRSVRIDKADPRERLAEAMKTPRRDEEGFRFILLPFTFGKRLRILTQEALPPAPAGSGTPP